MRLRTLAWIFAAGALVACSGDTPTPPNPTSISFDVRGKGRTTVIAVVKEDGTLGIECTSKAEAERRLGHR